MRSKLIAANWKMNGSSGLIDEMLEVIKPLALKSDYEIVIFPPTILLSYIKNKLQNSNISFGAQNVHSEKSGAFTGETSAPLLQEFGAKWCIVGHSERRSIFGETDQFIRGKIKTLLEFGIRPLICVGESKLQREKGIHEEVIISQLDKAISRLGSEEQLLCTIAYEPIWAIGSGKTATQNQVNSMHRVIRKELVSLVSEPVADKMKIIYGGSVNSENIESFVSQSEIDGALVGGASLKTEFFKRIL